MSCGTLVRGNFLSLESDDIHIELDLNNTLEEDDVLAGVGLSHPGGPRERETDEWFPYPNKTVGLPS